MNAKWLGIGLLGIGAAAAGAAYFAKTPSAPAAPAAAASSYEAGGSPAAPGRSYEPERSVSAPAPAPSNATTVTVLESSPAPTKAAAKPPAKPEPRTEPTGSSDRPVAYEPPVSSEPPPPAAAAAAVPEPQQPRFDEVTVAADSVLGVSLESTISSETAKVEDRVNARVSRDVLVDGKVAVPSGARLEGVVTEVTRGGKFKERPRIGVTFQTLILADGTKIALTTDPVFRDGEAPSNVKAKVGGTSAVGAILGAMIGGKKGAVLGGAAGAAGGAAVVAAGDRAEVQLLSGSSLTVRLQKPITVLVERHHEEPNDPR